MSELRPEVTQEMKEVQQIFFPFKTIFDEISCFTGSAGKTILNGFFSNTLKIKIST